MTTVAFGLFFALAMFGGLAALALFDSRVVPPITGTCAFILALAALAITVIHQGQP